MKRFISVLSIFVIFAIVFISYNYNTLSYVYAAKKEEKYIDAERFYEAISLIKNLYIDNVSDTTIMNGAIRGMLFELDPYSNYYTPEQYKIFMSGHKGRFGGLGITIGVRDGLLTVMAPIEDTPAYRAGIKSGDIIYKIDNITTKGMFTDEAVELMRGEPKTSVTLTIIRKDEPAPLVFNLIRDIIKIKAIKSELIGNIGYIKLTGFQENISKELKDIVKNLISKGVKGLILDLRFNPGGSLQEAIDVSGLFLPSNSVIVSTKSRQSEQVYKSSFYSYHNTDIPLVVLVNEGSASASEIVAGALQDYKRAEIVGTQTFGKGSVQSIFELKNGAGISLTTARYYTAKGRSIHGIGIEPDILVEQGDDVNYSKSLRSQDAGDIEDINKDHQLSEAITILKRDINVRKKVK